MPSLITHGFAGGVLGKTYTAEKMPARFWALSVLCSVIPDLDIIGFRFGIHYDDMLGHRGFSHSLLFALILSLMVVLLAFNRIPRFSKKWWAMVGYFFVVTVSHGLLDAMTTGGYGVGFFIPFDSTRYFLPWRIMRVSPISISAFFGARGARVLLSEFVGIWIPLLLVYAGVAILRKKTAQQGR